MPKFVIWSISLRKYWAGYFLLFWEQKETACYLKQKWFPPASFSCWAGAETQTEGLQAPQEGAYTQTDLMRTEGAAQTLRFRELWNLEDPLGTEGRGRWASWVQICPDGQTFQAHWHIARRAHQAAYYPGIQVRD